MTETIQFKWSYSGHEVVVSEMEVSSLRIGDDFIQFPSSGEVFKFRSSVLGMFLGLEIELRMYSVLKLQVWVDDEFIGTVSHKPTIAVSSVVSLPVLRIDN